LASPKEKGEANDIDWGDIFTRLLVHTNISYEDIGERTLPQITAIFKNLPKHIVVSNPFGLFGSVPAETTSETLENSFVSSESPKNLKLSQITGFCNQFNSIGK